MKLLATLLLVSVALADPVPVVDDKVYADLESQGTANVILHFKGPKTSEILAQFREEHRPFERTVHHDVLPSLLEANANKHQAKTLGFLKAKAQAKSSGSDYFQLWVVNQIAVQNASIDLIEEFKKNDEIIRIEAEEIYQLLSPLPPMEAEPIVRLTDPVEPVADILQSGNQWGVNDVGAPEVWAKGYTGKGVVVGVVDSGIRGSHEILRSNYRSSYGWFDAINRRSTAYDDNGHGSHCAGSILGKNGYGVAPDATLIGCKALSASGSGSSTALRACGQFMICPTDPAGNNKDCSKKPKVISNSWGMTGTSTFYNDIIDTMVNNGQIVLFANGNAGSKCSTTGSPADYTWAIAVGATDIDGRVASFSSRGPATSSQRSRTSPDVSGPGVDIKSAGYTSDTHYQTMSGTSMATPHVAGVAALYCSADSTLTQQDVFNYLINGAKATKTSGESCGGISDSTYPNNQVGYGKVYAPAAFA